MMQRMQYAALALALALASTTSAHAETVTMAYGGTLDQVVTFLFGWLIGNGHSGSKHVPTKVNVAPELNPESALGALMLIGGTLTVLRSRRKS